MKTTTLRSIVLGSVVALGTMVSCEKSNNGPENDGPSGPDIWGRKFITLTAAFPDGEGTAGNGGTRAFSITPEQAADPNFEVDAIGQGYVLRSQRTARVQGSVNGNFLYNIQYTGADGGIFNKYLVEGQAKFADTREELDTEPILGQAPRWVVAAEGTGVGVYASATVQASKEGADADFIDVKSNARIAVIDLDNPEISRQTEFEIPLTAEQTKNGYQIGRIDVPIINAAKNKLFIGCNLTRIDVTKKSTLNNSGNQTWSSATATLGTATLVVDYPSLANPKLIYSTNSRANNHSYRTMTQYLGSDGNIYQATATSGSQILRISSSTGEYDASYNFDVKAALGAGGNVQIRAWRYIQDGTAVVMYTETGVNGGFLAVLDLNTKTATKISTEKQSDVGYSGLSANQNNGTALTGTFGQFQHIAVSGDNVYIPMTPNGVDGNLYVINWKTKQAVKGAKLKNQSGSFYIGAY